MLKPGSIPYQVIELCKKGIIHPIVNEEILAEYEDVLLRNKFGFEKDTVVGLINELIDNSMLLEKTNSDEMFIDENDRVFYEIVLTARKENDNSYLVTGNLKHFPIKHYIVTPRQMLEIIEKEN